MFWIFSSNHNRSHLDSQPHLKIYYCSNYFHLFFQGRQPGTVSTRSISGLWKIFGKIIPRRMWMQSGLQSKLLARNGTVLWMVHPGPLQRLIPLSIQPRFRWAGHFTYRISSYSFRGNYSFLNLEIVANSNSCGDNSTFYLINWIFALETVQGWKL